MFERNGNDSTIIRNQVTGFIVYFKHDYGFIRPDDKSFDDLFFHVKEVEPWREGFKSVKGKQDEKIIQQPDGSTIVIPFFPGEKVKFDIKESGKMVKGKKGYKATNIDLLTEYTGSKIIEGTIKNGR